MIAYEMPVAVSFGDCDPAEIVFYPNYFRWFDATFHAFLESRGCGQKVLAATLGTVGTGLIDAGATFRAPVSFGDRLTVAMTLTEWKTRTFRLDYRACIDDRLAVEGFEIRGLFMRDGAKLSAAPVAPLKALLERGGDDIHSV